MYRKIKTAIWDEFKFYDFCPNDQLLLLYLLTNDHTSIHGVYRADIQTICKEVGFNVTEIKNALNTLMKYRLISVNEKGNYQISKKIMGFIWWTHGKGGELSGNWKGGITPLNIKIRASEDYRHWRLSVYFRDNFTCQNCGKKEKINAHHVKSFSKYPELRIDINNGITLCESCHKKWHREHGRGN